VIEIVVVGAVVLGFAILVTAHVTIAFGLVRRTPRWRAPVALVVAPLAPYWAWREHMRVRAGVWTAALVVYVVAMALAWKV
jgi:hypothetical protein